MNLQVCLSGLFSVIKMIFLKQMWQLKRFLVRISQPTVSQSVYFVYFILSASRVKGIGCSMLLWQLLTDLFCLWSRGSSV